MRKTVIIRFKDPDENGHIAAKAESVSDWDVVREYIEKQGGSQAVKLAQSVVRLWAEIEIKPGEESRCTGVVGIRQIWDVPFLHVEDRLARGRLMRRASIVLEESCRAGERAFVYVDKEVEEDWKEFLTALGGFPANRWSVAVALGE